MPMEIEIDRNQCSRSAPIDRKGYNKETRTAPVTVATEQPVVVYDRSTWDLVREILPVSGARIPASNQIPMLDSHMRYSTDNIKGSIRNLRIENDNIVGDAVFSSLSEKEATLVDEGHLTDVSAGYTVSGSQTTRLRKGESTNLAGREYSNDFTDGMDLLIRTSWELKEGSLVPVGADDAAKFRSADLTIRGINPQQGGTMPAEKDDSLILAARTAEIDEAKRAGIAEGQRLETARRSEVGALIEIANLPAEKKAELTRSLLDGGKSAAESTQLIATEVRAQLAKKAELPTIQVTVEQSDKERGAIADALLYRAGTLKQGKDAETDKRIENVQRSGMPGSIHEIVHFMHAKERSGHALWSREDIARKAVEYWQGRGSSTLGTGDFANILLDVANKMVGTAFQEEFSSFAEWTESGSVTDFKQVNLISKSHMSDWAKVKEGEAPIFGKFADKKEVGSIDTYSLAVPFSRKALINDDMGMFNDMLSMIGAGAKRKVNDICCEALVSNALAGPGMTEVTNMFEVNIQKNIKASSGKVSHASLSLANSMLKNILKPRPDKTSVQRIMGRPARILLSGTDEQDNIERFLGAQFDLAVATTTAQGTPNIWKGRLKPVFDDYLQALLTAASAQYSWYLFSEPVFKVLYLNGQSTPILRRAENGVGEALGITMDGYFDFGLGMKDWRIAQYNDGK